MSLMLETTFQEDRYRRELRDTEAAKNKRLNHKGEGNIIKDDDGFARWTLSNKLEESAVLQRDP